MIDALNDHVQGLFLLKPPGFMNTCGGPTSEAAKKRGISPEEILVVCDDFSLPLGTIRIRLKGSSGGHNGLESILQAFETLGIPRLRLGIGLVPPGVDPAEFVLEAFQRNQEMKIRPVIERAAEAVGVIAQKGLEAAMNIYNQRGVG